MTTTNQAQIYLGANIPPDFSQGEVMTLPKEEYQFLLNFKEQVEQTKEQRKISQKKYFLKHKEQYYATQKKWRDKNKDMLNKRRRELYAGKSDADKKLMDEADLIEEKWFKEIKANEPEADGPAINDGFLNPFNIADDDEPDDHKVVVNLNSSNHPDDDEP